MVHFAFFKKMVKRGVGGENPHEPPLLFTYIPTQQTLETISSSPKLIVEKLFISVFEKY